MSRVKTPDPENLTPEQKPVYDAIMAGPRGHVVGPLAVWLNRPELCNRAQDLGAYARYGTCLEPRLSELAIIVSGRFWGAEFEWYSHKKIALKAGISPEAVEAIRTNQTPKFDKDDERIVYEFALTLQTEHKVSDALYRSAIETLGQDAVIDLVGVLGYYTLIAMTIKAFEVDLPEGAKPELG